MPDSERTKNSVAPEKSINEEKREKERPKHRSYALWEPI
jgi:hypothetical protein